MSVNLETNYQVKDLGMTLTEKWTTDNNLSTTVDVVDKLIPGCKVSLDTSLLRVPELSQVTTKSTISEI